MDNGAWKWIYFAKNDDLNDLSIRNTLGFQAANSRASLPGYKIDRDGSGVNQLTRGADGKEFKVSNMEIWEI